MIAEITWWPLDAVGVMWATHCALHTDTVKRLTSRGASRGYKIARAQYSPAAVSRG